MVRQSNGISFIYDHNSLIGFKYENAKYFYRKDILGNIIAILDSNGEVVVRYTYNAWGVLERRIRRVWKQICWGAF